LRFGFCSETNLAHRLCDPLDPTLCIRNVALQKIMTKSISIVAFGAGAGPGDTLSADTLGLKAKVLCAAAQLGLPVPPGFVVMQELAREFADKNQSSTPVPIAVALAHLETATGLLLNGAQPLLLAVRTSTVVSIPGTGEAVLNLGLNDDTVEALARNTADARYAYDSYCRFIQNYAQVVMGDDPSVFEDISALYMEERGYVSDTELQGSDMRELSVRYKAQYESNNAEGFPQDPLQQLKASCAALLRSWSAPRARTHRKLQGLSESQGLAIIVQAMVNGALGPQSGAGHVTTRHPQTGAAQMTGAFVLNATGQELSASLLPNLSLDTLSNVIPAGFAELSVAVQGLEYQLRDGLDVDFVFENGKLWLLSAKPCRRNAQAALHLALDYASKGLLSREEVVLRIDPLSLDQLLHSTIDPDEKRTIVATGLPASPGAVSGLIIFDAEEARTLAAQGRRVILVRPETMPEDIRGLHAAEGVLTTRGGMTSHAAVIARGMGKPCVSGASTLKIDSRAGTLTAPGMTLNRYDIITLDGATGQILKGAIPTLKPELSGDFATLLEWADACRRMKVRANAETVQDALMARDFGAEGIGLCRTEHMFFEGERLVAMREMILADKEKDRRAALAKVLPMLRGDFVAMFEIMAGLPVTIRLLDPPLHEFLPDGGPEIEAVAKSLNADPELLRKRIQELHEQNPMLGHRGVRLLLSFPEIVEMQARAIFEAVVEVQKTADAPPIPEIMVPLVASRMELDLVRARIDATAIAVEKETGTVVAYRVGTMIELPRAALKAGDIASSAEFFSFGTNDLTQTTFGISRDDSSRFISEYQTKGIFNRDPFVTLDVDGVGELIDLAVQRGRATRHDIHLGICGEHGGDPDSIAFCEAKMLDYVSCSPYRVPIARLACAQASLRNRNKLN
jgi:pyruvate, orthophosphate dikinase